VRRHRLLLNFQAEADANTAHRVVAGQLAALPAS
jgi:hypothetical protein